MIDDLIWISDLPQRLAFVTLLPARFLAGTFPQARHPCRFVSQSLNRRLAAVRTVQPVPALEALTIDAASTIRLPAIDRGAAI